MLALCLVLTVVARSQDLEATAQPGDPIAAASANYAKLDSYRVTLRSRHGEGPEEVIRYAFKRPGYVRMDFVRPHSGAVLVYDPTTKRVRLWPFGLSSRFSLNLPPGNRLVRSAQGHTADQSDIGALLGRVRALQQRGTTSLRGHGQVGGRDTVLVEVAGEDGYAVAGTHRYLLDLEAVSLLPLRVRAYDTAGNLAEDVLMDDLETGARFDDAFFTP